MSNEPYAVAVCCADLHLWHKPPLARSVEVSWWKVMANYLDALEALREKYDVIAIIAGDIFDHYNPNPEMVNFACRRLPKRCYSVPGQHDLLYHQLTEIGKTAYWTLVEAQVLTHLSANAPLEVSSKGMALRLHGFPWGVDIKPLNKPHDLLLEIAVVHAYVWTKKTGYPGAPEANRIATFAKKLKGFDVAVCGDNHRSFDITTPQGTRVFNSGSFMRRKSDEKGHRPSVGVIYSDGTIKRQYLDCSADKWLEDTPQVTQQIGFESFVEELSALGAQALSFGDAVRRLMEREKVPQSVKDVVVKLLGEVKG